MAAQAGIRKTGTVRPVTSTSEIQLGTLYVVEGYIHPIGSLSDSLLQRAVNELVDFDSPIDVTYASIEPDGHVVIQGKATHGSPVLLIGSALVLLLAGIGIALSVSHIYTITDAVIAGGRLPGGAAGDAGTAAAGGSLWDLVPLALIGVAVFLFIRYR